MTTHQYSPSANVKINNSDCIAFLKSLKSASVDIIVTDPAYSGMNQKLKFGHGRIVGHYQAEGNSKWFQEFHDDPENYKVFLTECNRVLKDNRHIYIMFDSFSLLTLGPIIRDYFEVKNIITWDKVAIGMGHYFRRRHEFIIFSTKGHKKLSKRNIPDVWRFRRIHSKHYPTQKPVEVFEAMLKGSVEKDYVVCDPFVGSGSSAIAALKKGCKFIGADISKTACELTCTRIKDYLSKGIDPLQDYSACPETETSRYWE